jgi:hypothetical protein
MSRFGAKRCFSFTFVGPRTLDEILKKELVQDKSATEVADLWYTYHENKVGIYSTWYIVPNMNVMCDKGTDRLIFSCFLLARASWMIG